MTRQQTNPIQTLESHSLIQHYLSLIYENPHTSPSHSTTPLQPTQLTTTPTLIDTTPMDVIASPSSNHSPLLDRASTLALFSPATRSMHNIHKPNKSFLLTTKHPLPSTIEPTCVSEAMKSPKWHEAMSNEFNALLAQGT